MISNAETITIYHKGLDPQTRLEKWTPTYYHDCWWFDTKGNAGRDGYQFSNRVEVRIPYKKNENAQITDISIRGYTL